MSTLEVKELSHPSGEGIKIAAGKTLDLKSQGTTTLPTGSVLQVVSETFGTEVSFTSGTYIDSGLSATITPSSSSNKILIIANMHGYINGTAQIGMNIVRDSTQIEEASRMLGYDDNTSAMMTLIELHAPTTTNAVTYKVQVKRTAGTANCRINQQTGDGCKLILMEIAG